MSAIVELVGPKVKGKDKEVDTSEFTGEGKVVGLYFSAHWCPPCRGFTPVLAEKYKKWKEAGANFEIVFISSDRDQKSFDEYYSEMPWLALDFSNRDLKTTCSSKFGVSGIPCLVFLNGNTGEIITKDGRGLVMSNEDYPAELK